MKAILIITSLAISIFLGNFPGIDKARPKYWMVLVTFFFFATLFINLLPPLACTPADAEYYSTMKDSSAFGVYISISPEKPYFDHAEGNWTFKILDGRNATKQYNMIYEGMLIPDELKLPDKMILNMRYDKTRRVFNYISTSSIAPLMVFPYIMQLEEKIKIMNFHVPVAWVTVLAFLLSMIYSVLYLKTSNFKNDIKAVASAGIGFVFCVLATVTGMIWAKFNWGTFWNWDPREVSIFVLLLIYGAYFALRTAIDREDLRARLSAVYSIIAFVTVPFFIFILPRITGGLHPGSASETNSGPVLGGGDMLNPSMQIAFAVSLGAVTLLFFWLQSIAVRSRILELNTRVE